jgi:hypothetical protein
MKTYARPAVLLCLSLISALAAPFARADEPVHDSPTIIIDRTQQFSQTGASTVTEQTVLPFSFNFHIRGGTGMSNWGPAFYKPGSGGTPQSGSSTATNTGTLNFSASPNNVNDFMFVHDFSTNAAMASFYPIAPTDGGQYGIKFLGSAPPSPAEFTAGLVYAAGTTYPSVTPQITAVDNGAVWTSNGLRLKATGTTTLSLNSFPEYYSATYGTLMSVGIYDAASGDVIGSASLETGNLPMGDSSTSPTPVSFPPITQVTVNGAWLIPGHTYTLELQYSVLAGRPEETTVNGIEWQGASTYRKITTISIGVATSALNDFDGDGQSEVLWRNISSGVIASWTSGTGYQSFGSESGMNWKAFGGADFDGDGQSEVLWRNISSGVIASWTSGTGYQSFGSESGSSWTAFGAADFDADGQAEVLWRNSSSGVIATWATTTGYQSFGSESGMSWKALGGADFDGDGQAEVYWRNSSSGVIATWTSTTGYQSFGSESGSSWKVASAGDFDGDGQAEILWRNISSGVIASWTSTTGYQSFGSESGSSWKVIGVAE